MNDSSYRVAARHGLTASQHYALRLIGHFGDAHLLTATAQDVAVVTLRALLKRGLIEHRKPRQGSDRVFARVDDTWPDFTLTPEGREKTEAMGEWLP